MPNSDSTLELYEALRVLAAQNPRAARLRFEQILIDNSVDVDEILQRMSSPGEGRLRQLVANFARSRSDRSRFAKHFAAWLDVETDQFARRAISAALDEQPVAPSRSPQRNLAARDLVEMYRYVSERLRHELQNALLGPKTRILQLVETIKRLDEGITRAELEAILGKLRDEFQTIGRFAEFEPNDNYFAVRPMILPEWLEQMGRDYAKRFSRIDLRCEGSDVAKAQPILGSDYLLRLVFWNLWVNAHQTVGNPCSIALHFLLRDDALDVVIVDNGKGFPEEMVDVAFRDRYSSRGPNRGRGLLEVQDAIQQLHGDAQLTEWQPAEYRVRLTFSAKAI